MKRVGVWALGIGLVVTLGLLAVKQGYAEEKGHEPTCNLATLKGRYLFGGVITIGAHDQQLSLVAVAGYHIFNGDSTGIDMVTGRNNAGLPEETNAVFPIRYTVNPDCSGTYTVEITDESGEIIREAHFGIFIAPTGEELIVIGTDPNVITVQGPNRRVSHK
jgi:hypothetical protein